MEYSGMLYRKHPPVQVNLTQIDILYRTDFKFGHRSEKFDSLRP